MSVTRYDRAEVKARRNQDGFIHDTPVLTRTGVFIYHNPDGSERREYRPPDEVFAQDSLNAYKGIPITRGHPGKVTSSNAKNHTIGTVLSAARQDGNNLLADIVIHDPAAINAGNKELSVGYELDLEETAGITPEGERYDAIQRNIRPNHLAIVSKGRAGNARLNMDGNEAVDDKDETMTKIRLDNGIEYDAAPEVIQAHNQLKQDAAEAKSKQAQAEARADSAEADLKALQDKQPQIKQDALKEARERLQLEAVAKTHGVDFKEDTAAREIKVAVIKAIRGDALVLDGKTDDYVAAAFDMALAAHDEQAKNKALAGQRQDMANKEGAGGVSAAQAREQYKASLKGAE